MRTARIEYIYMHIDTRSGEKLPGNAALTQQQQQLQARGENNRAYIIVPHDAFYRARCGENAS